MHCLLRERLFYNYRKTSIDSWRWDNVAILNRAKTSVQC